jgi:two-component system CheB/CheR fusion protein
VVLAQDHSIRTANTAFRDLTGMNVRELEDRCLPDLARHLWGLENLEEKLNQLLQSPAASIEFVHHSATAQKKTLQIKAQALSTDGSRVLVLMIEDITSRRDAENLFAQQNRDLEGKIDLAARNLTRTQDELHALAAHLFTVQEEERQRVARELHDDISQRLSVLEILLHEMMNGAPMSMAPERIESVRAQVQTLNNDVRQISHRLHPAILQDLGLPTALKAMVQEFGERENMPATYTSNDLPGDWPPEAATALYRIAQEALRNVSKHAGKTHVKVILSGADRQLQLRVTDFGQGFDEDTESPAHGLGMISMQERARLAGGTLEVKSSLGHGTTVTAVIPLDLHA